MACSTAFSTAGRCSPLHAHMIDGAQLALCALHINLLWVPLKCTQAGKIWAIKNPMHMLQPAFPKQSVSRFPRYVFPLHALRAATC